jgi:hypothetical protein
MQSPCRRLTGCVDVSYAADRQQLRVFLRAVLADKFATKSSNFLRKNEVVLLVIFWLDRLVNDQKRRSHERQFRQNQSPSC